jgi:hypothetical protein
LLRSIATATSLNGSPVSHSKWDNTNMQYIGRSFGVGSSAGLADRHIAALGNIRGYTYHEVGFQAEVRCIHNQSSASRFELLQYSTEGMAPNIYTAVCALPNSNWTQIREVNGTKRDG